MSYIRKPRLCRHSDLKPACQPLRPQCTGAACSMLDPALDDTIDSGYIQSRALHYAERAGASTETVQRLKTFLEDPLTLAALSLPTQQLHLLLVNDLYKYRMHQVYSKYMTGGIWSTCRLAPPSQCFPVPAAATAIQPCSSTSPTPPGVRCFAHKSSVLTCGSLTHPLPLQASLLTLPSTSASARASRRTKTTCGTSRSTTHRCLVLVTLHMASGIRHSMHARPQHGLHTNNQVPLAGV
jgi:hypothetical protein